ncbi:hypothetical protein CCB80_15400 [Armatimonadetes bacterium Uphvl-Ar1]|nr:hypothetical protein CCB80_15400 [Armatimonadetes bacterium Uphvl-Ar1]
MRCSLSLSLSLLALSALSHAGQYVLNATHDGVTNPSGGVGTTNNGSVGYGWSSGSYGSTQTIDAQPAAATCSGEIKWVFVWQRDMIPGTNTPDLGDNPPPSVVVEEFCEAKYAWSPFEGSGSGSCDNGLGFAVVETQEFNVRRGIASGVRYRLQGGGETVEISLSPSAQASADFGSVSASVKYTCTIYIPEVSLEGLTNFSGALKVLAGQEVISSFVLKPSFSQYPMVDRGLRVKSKRWFEPDVVKPFKDFVPARATNQYQALTRADHLADQLKFFTAAKGTFEVPCMATLEFPEGARVIGDGIPVTPDLPLVFAKSRQAESKKFDVETTGRVGNVVLYTNQVEGFGPLGVGDAGNLGSRWATKFKPFDSLTDFALDGIASFAQIANFSRSLQRSLAAGAPSGTPTNFSLAAGNGKSWLDVQYPYPFSEGVSTSGFFPIIEEVKGSDNPLHILSLNNLQWTNRWETSEARDSFETYTMYRPPSKDGLRTMLVPYSIHNWYWSGEASRNATGGWQVKGEGKMSSVEQTDNHPTWVRVMPYGGFNFSGF